MARHAAPEPPEQEEVEPVHAAVPSWPMIWQAVQIGLYTAVMTFLAGAITNGVGIAWNGTGRAALNAGIAAVLGFLGWAAGAATVSRQRARSEPPTPP